MYGGKIQEIAPVERAVRAIRCIRTRRGCWARFPASTGERAHRLTVIPGNVPSILDLPVGCKFVTRCPHRFEPCADIEPPLIEIEPDHFVRCHLYPA